MVFFLLHFDAGMVLLHASNAFHQNFPLYDIRMHASGTCKPEGFFLWTLTSSSVHRWLIPCDKFYSDISKTVRPAQIFLFHKYTFPFRFHSSKLSKHCRFRDGWFGRSPKWNIPVEVTSKSYRRSAVRSFQLSKVSSHALAF